jgi:hypothetical protein
MQNLIKTNLFTQENAERAKQKIIDFKKPLLIIACFIVTVLVILQVVRMTNKTQSPIQELMAKQQNNIVIIADQLEIQQDKRSKRNVLQAQIEALNVEINASKDIVVQAETANAEIKDQMLVIANPLPITNTGDDNK